MKNDYADSQLVMVMQLFCGILAFNSSVRRHVKSIGRDVAAGRMIPKLEKQESDLYMNPRRVR